LLSPPNPHQAEQERNAIDAAKRAGVGHVVALSVLGSSLDASVAFGRWHGEIDRHLAESGLPHTLLLPSGFMQNFLAAAQYVAEQGVLYGMTGETRVSYVDTRDVAAVAARVLTSPGHQGKAYALTGPEALSGDEVAERLSAATGRQVGSVDVPADTFRQALAGAGLPGWLVDRLIELNTMMAAGHAPASLTRWPRCSDASRGRSSSSPPSTASPSAASSGSCRRRRCCRRLWPTAGRRSALRATARR
jgi:uncharacterized protein YbjT (DUF2867 family)